MGTFSFVEMTDKRACIENTNDNDQPLRNADMNHAKKAARMLD